MMHRQQEHQIEQRINSEVQIVRSQFERDRQVMIQNFQAKLDQMTTNLMKSVDEVEVQTMTRELCMEDSVVSCSIISNINQENIKELQEQLKVKDQEMSNIKDQVHLIQEQIKDYKWKIQEKVSIIQSLENYNDAKQYTEELFRYVMQLNKPIYVVNSSQTQADIQYDAEISCNFETFENIDELDMLKTQITELQETIHAQAVQFKEQTIQYNYEVGKSQAQLNQINELNAQHEGKIIRLLTQIDARDYTRELLKQAQQDKVFYSQYCQTAEPTNNDQDTQCDLTQLEQQILSDQNRELKNQIELLQYSNNELIMTNQNLQEQLQLVIPKKSFDEQIQTEEQSSALQNQIIEEEIVGESIVSQWEQYSSELQSQLTNIQLEYSALEQRLNEKEVLIQNQQTQILDYISQLTSQTVREFIDNESQCELLTSDQLYESSLKCQELSTHQQYLLDENTRIVSDYDYLLNQKNDDISYLQQQLLDKDQQLLAHLAIEKHDQETQCELVTQESINELQKLICNQQEIIDSLKSQEIERVDFEIQVTDESSLQLIEDLQSEINRLQATIEQIQQQAAEDQTVVKSLEDQLLTCQQQLSQMQEDKQMAIASKDQELLALQKQVDEAQEISSVQIKQTQEQQEVQCNIITLQDIEEKDEQLSILKEANETIKSQNQHLGEELKEVNLHLQNQKAQFEEIQEEMQSKIDQLSVELKDTQNKSAEEVQKNTKNLTIDNEIQCQLLSISDLELLQLNLDTLQREHQDLKANYQEGLMLMEQLRLENSQQLQIIENVKQEINQKDEIIYDISCEKMELEKKLIKTLTSEIEVECNIITSEDLLALTYQVKQAQSKVEEQQQTSSQLQYDVDSHKEENLRLAALLNEAQISINKYQIENQECQQCHEREAESSSLKAHIDQLTSEYHKLEDSIKGLPEELKQRHEMIEALNNKVKELMVANSGNIDSSKNIEALSHALLKLEEDNKQKDTIINQLKEQMIKIVQQEQQHGPPISPKMTIMEKSQLTKQGDEGTYVFCYGSNHPLSMAKNLGLTIQEFLSRCISCGLPGYGRVFVGTSPNWGNCSFANIIPHAKSEVEGYAVKLSEEELMKLDQSVGYPKIYNRIKVSLKKLPYTEGEILIEGAAYLLIEKQLLSKYKRPTAEYLDATCKTLSASLFLRIGAYEDNKHELKLKVFKQTDITLDLLHETFASMKFLLS